MRKLSAALAYVTSLPDESKHGYLVTIHGMTGSAYFELQEYAQALNHYKRALGIAEQQ